MGILRRSGLRGKLVVGAVVDMENEEWLAARKPCPPPLRIGRFKLLYGEEGAIYENKSRSPFAGRVGTFIDW